MEEFQQQVLIGIARALNDAAEQFRKAPLPRQLSDQLKKLVQQLDEPCVLAVVGRAKVGKSTFVNALLGADLAKVGVTETTATINFFRHGQPSKPDRPIRCHWRDGRVEDVDRSFYESLQGNNKETLERALAIERLEFLLSHEVLRRVTIVDTPGTEAVVEEHRQAAAEFLSLRKQLREQHNRDTQRWTSEADAVIYLISQVPRETDETLLKQFQEATGGRSRAFNAVGAVAKIDLYPEIRSRIARIAKQLRDNLNTVVPISAGLQRALDRLMADNAAGLRKIVEIVSRIPKTRLSKLLDNNEFWDEKDFEDCPVSAQERRALRADMEWSVFVTLVKTLLQHDTNIERALPALKELTGFEPLMEVLECHFFRRAKLLRACRILKVARNILDEVRYKHLPNLEHQDETNRKQLKGFVPYISSPGIDSSRAREFVERFSSQAQHVETICKKVDLDISKYEHELEEYNACIEGLTILEKNRSLFTDAECRELEGLFGLYGFERATRLGQRLDSKYAPDRQDFWSIQASMARQEARRRVADLAWYCYGCILTELTGG